MMVSSIALALLYCGCWRWLAKSWLVGRPLDGGQVHAVLVHVPQRGQLAQLADLALDQRDGEIDVFLGGEAADGEADRAVRQFIAAAQARST